MAADQERQVRNNLTTTRQVSAQVMAAPPRFLTNPDHILLGIFLNVIIVIVLLLSRKSLGG